MIAKGAAGLCHQLGFRVKRYHRDEVETLLKFLEDIELEIALLSFALP